MVHFAFSSTSPGGRAAGRAGGRVLEELKLRLAQPSWGLKLGLGLSLAKTVSLMATKVSIQLSVSLRSVSGKAPNARAKMGLGVGRVSGFARILLSTGKLGLCLG